MVQFEGVSTEELQLIREARREGSVLRKGQRGQLSKTAWSYAAAVLMAARPDICGSNGIVKGGFRNRLVEVLRASDAEARDVAADMRAIGLVEDAGGRRLRVVLPDGLRHFVEQADEQPSTALSEAPSGVRENTDPEQLTSDPGGALIERTSSRALDFQRQAKVAGLTFELVAGMDVESEALPSIVEHLVKVLEQLEPRDLLEFVGGLRQELQANGH